MLNTTKDQQKEGKTKQVEQAKVNWVEAANVMNTCAHKELCSSVLFHTIPTLQKSISYLQLILIKSLSQLRINSKTERCLRTTVGLYEKIENRLKYLSQTVDFPKLQCSVALGRPMQLWENYVALGKIGSFRESGLPLKLTILDQLTCRGRRSQSASSDRYPPTRNPDG